MRIVSKSTLNKINKPIKYVIGRHRLITIILTILITLIQMSIQYFDGEIDNNYKEFLGNSIFLLNDNTNIASYTSNVGIQNQRFSDLKCSECVCGSDLCDMNRKKYCTDITNKLVLVETELSQKLIKGAESKVNDVEKSIKNLNESKSKNDPIIRRLRYANIFFVLIIVVINSVVLFLKEEKDEK